MNKMINNKIAQSSKHHKSGFTLIELSIVLVIIGLIVGAITAGSSLIKQATLRSVISDIRTMQIAINTFKLTYGGALPGDLSNATSYWNTTNNGSLATNLANGNANGSIDNNEYQTALQMLSLAGLLPTTVAFNAAMPSKYGSNAAYLLYNHGSGTIYGRGGTGSVLEIMYYVPGSNNAGNTVASWAGTVTPTDAYNIDMKMDDGVLYTGIVYTAKNWAANFTLNTCTKLGTYIASDYATISADNYHLADTTRSCWMFFWIVD